MVFDAAAPTPLAASVDGASATTQRQRLVAIALASCAFQTQAAKLANVSTRTIRRWLQHPDFLVLLEHERERYADATRAAYVEEYRRRCAPGYGRRRR